MLSTALIVAFIGVSFTSALTLFAACITVGRAERKQMEANSSRGALSGQPSPMIDIEWRRLDKQPA